MESGTKCSRYCELGVQLPVYGGIVGKYMGIWIAVSCASPTLYRRRANGNRQVLQIQVSLFRRHRDRGRLHCGRQREGRLRRSWEYSRCSSTMAGVQGL